VRRADLPGNRLAEVISLADRKHAALAIAQRPRAVASLETALVLCRRLLADGAEPTLEKARLGAPAPRDPYRRVSKARGRLQLVPSLRRST
jgi:hypothetical protein